MSLISSTTGHDRKQERTIAIELYVAIAIAIVLGAIIFFVVGQNSSMNPFERNVPAPTNSGVPHQ